VTAWYDEILEVVVRDELLDQGLDEDSTDEAIAVMGDEGMFGMPGPEPAP
jgi:hypothetical protein